MQSSLPCKFIINVDSDSSHVFTQKHSFFNCCITMTCSICFNPMSCRWWSSYSIPCQKNIYPNRNEISNKYLKCVCFEFDNTRCCCCYCSRTFTLRWKDVTTELNILILGVYLYPPKVWKTLQRNGIDWCARNWMSIDFTASFCESVVGLLTFTSGDPVWFGF